MRRGLAAERWRWDEVKIESERNRELGRAGASERAEGARCGAKEAAGIWKARGF